MKLRTLLPAVAALFLFAPVHAKAGCLIESPVPMFCWLDTHGTASASCPASTLFDHKFTALKHTYRFTGSCSVSSAETAYNRPYTADGTWDGKVATEVTNFGKDGTVTITASCPYDPWLNVNTPCVLISATPKPTIEPLYTYMQPPYPRTAFGLSSALRQQLWTEEQASPQIPVPEAPVFVSPPCNVSYPVGKSVKIVIERNPNLPIGWTFEWRKTLLVLSPFNPFTPDTDYKSVGMIVSQGKSMRRTVKFNKAGDWRVTVASAFPGAPTASCILTMY